MAKFSTIYYIFIVVVFYYPTFGYADQSIAMGGNSAQTHISFKIIIPQSLSLSVSALSQNNTLTGSSGIEDGHSSVLHTIEKTGNAHGAGNLENMKPSNFLSRIFPIDNFELNQNLQQGSWVAGNIPFLGQNENSGYNKSIFFATSLKDQFTISYLPTSLKLLPPQKGLSFFILCSP